MDRIGNTVFRLNGNRKVKLPPFKPQQGFCPELPLGSAGPGMVNLQLLLFLANGSQETHSRITAPLAGYDEGQEVAVGELGEKILSIAAAPVPESLRDYYFRTAMAALVGLTGVEGIIQLLRAPGISEEERGFVAASTFGLLEYPDAAAPSPLKGLRVAELDLVSAALREPALQPFRAGLGRVLKLNAFTAAQNKGMYRKMFAANPRWRVYLSMDDIQHVGRTLAYSPDDTVFSLDTRQKAERIFKTVTQKRINLFTRGDFSENVRGLALKRVISMVLVGRWVSFGTTTQRKVAKGFAIKDEWPSAEKDARVLRGIRFRRDFFDPRSGQLNANLRQRILAVNTMDKKDLLPAVEELEALLGKIVS